MSLFLVYMLSFLVYMSSFLAYMSSFLAYMLSLLSYMTPFLVLYVVVLSEHFCIQRACFLLNTVVVILSINIFNYVFLTPYDIVAVAPTVCGVAYLTVKTE